MVSVEKVIAELRELTQDQLGRVAQAVHELASERNTIRPNRQSAVPVPESIVAKAIRNGWPNELFTDVIGRVDESFERPPQLEFESRPGL
jgi:hypothetical protein